MSVARSELALAYAIARCGNTRLWKFFELLWQTRDLGCLVASVKGTMFKLVCAPDKFGMSKKRRATERQLAEAHERTG